MATTTRNIFELHQLHVVRMSLGAGGQFDFDQLPYRPDEVQASANVLSIGPGDGVTWVTADQANGALRLANEGDEVVAGFQVLAGKIRDVLAMLPRVGDVLVDGVPALPLNVLHVKSRVSLGADGACYVTQRVTPYIGPPTEEMVARKTKCAMCGILLSDAPDPKTGLVTRVITCQCGSVYHWETEESHPGVDPDDLLNCRDKIAACLVCQRPVRTESFLIWDPATR
jgi:hypothetical protein